MDVINEFIPDEFVMVYLCGVAPTKQSAPVTITPSLEIKQKKHCRQGKKKYGQKSTSR
jgi:hypothetical protein